MGWLSKVIGLLRVPSVLISAVCEFKIEDLDFCSSYIRSMKKFETRIRSPDSGSSRLLSNVSGGESSQRVSQCHGISMYIVQGKHQSRPASSELLLVLDLDFFLINFPEIFQTYF